MSQHYSEETLSALVDAELPRTEAQLIQAHLDACPLCRKQVTEYRTLRQGIKFAATVDLPETFAANVRRTIRSLAMPSDPWLGTERLAWRVVLALSLLVMSIVAIGSLQDSDQTVIMERYLSGNQADSVVQQVLLKPDEISRDDVLLAAVTH